MFYPYIHPYVKLCIWIFLQLIAILLCPSVIFQIRQLFLMKKKRKQSEYTAIYIIKDYLLLSPKLYKHTKISSADQGIGSHYYFFI